MKQLVFSVGVLCSLSLLSCDKNSKDPDDPNNGNGISESLHLSFKTPDWERHIDCSHLVLSPTYLNDTTYIVSARSQSTDEQFFFSYPMDSSVIVQPGNLKKYPIAAYGEHTQSFEFSQSLPITEGSSIRLWSEAGNDSKVYNEVTAVKYMGSEGNECIFRIKCRYSMITAEQTNASNKKEVSGTFHFEIRTTRS